MSNRKKAFETLSKNPAQYFIEWKSDHKCFSFYDKEKGENIQLELPFRFLALQEMHTIKGWNNASESGIYSNEVQYIGRTPIKVQSFKGGPIAEGLYKNIKLQVKEAGGIYHKSIYAMLENGSLVNIALKGSAVREWGEFIKKTKSRLYDEWILVDDAKEAKNGTITYSTPEFVYDVSINEKESEMADTVFDILEKYLKEYAENNETSNIEDADQEQDHEENYHADAYAADALPSDPIE